MLKNIEWGAVAYLSRSVYGKNEPVWNNSYHSKDGQFSSLTGACGNSQDAVTSGSNKTPDDAWYHYNAVQGGNASTTGNVYGVYDMAGGTWEFTASHLKGIGNLSTYSANLKNASDEFKDMYEIGTSNTQELNYKANANKYGDGIYETSTSWSGPNGWDKDNSNFLYGADYIVSIRGGGFYDGTGNGMFTFGAEDGRGKNLIGFRASIVISEP